LNKPVHLLLVDDHPENLLALGGVLSRPSYTLVTARSGAEALEQLGRHDFAVILLDVLMPGMDGFETARQIRERDGSRTTPIIFLTATMADLSGVYKGYAAGAVDYLVKPLDADVVRAKVSVFVELHRLRESERQRSADALRDSAALYEATFAQAAAGIAHVSLDRRWLRVNQRLCDVLGRDEPDLVGKHLAEIVLPEDREGVVAGLETVLAGEIAHCRREQRWQHENGGVLWVNVSASVLKDQLGSPRHYILVVEDITAAKEGEQAQRFLAGASDILLRSLDSGSTLAQVADLAVPQFADLCLVDVDDPESEAKDRDVVSAHGPVVQMDLWRELYRRLPTDPGHGRGKVVRTRRAELITDLGANLQNVTIDHAMLHIIERLDVRSLIIVPLLCRGRLLGTLAFATTGARRYTRSHLAVVEDLAQRAAFAIDNARLYHQAQRAVGVRDEFLSIASHELRTPLTSLHLLFHRLLDDDKGRAEADPSRRVMVRCETQLRRLSALVDNLLDMSRVSVGRFEIHREPADLADIVRDVVNRSSDAFANAKAPLQLRLDGAILGQWDRLRLEQVLGNLLANALKYGEGLPVEISVERRADRAHITVRDHGIGIAADQQQRIFDRFERAVSPRAYGGLGLGLYIARQIVEAHGGSISVQSTPGAGSSFIVELPVHVVETRRAPSESTAAYEQSP
jgi:PAS domain S-box-containing protein